ncbi:MAG: prephenate dehydrogenase/arogenate dehydrogenase family protein [Butyrivibrio sp.]
MKKVIGFIGLGLIGGSIAKALKKSDSSYYTVAYNRSREPLSLAVSEGIIDKPAYEIDDSFSECDIIFLCTPVEYNSLYLSRIKPFIKQGCIVTDVGSVKGYIHKTVSELDMEDCFIGGHPMAGSEKTGYKSSSAIILENAFFAITPTGRTSKKSIDFYISLIKEMGAVPIVTSPDRHDYAVAGISHVPHLIASSLVNLVKDNDTEDELMKSLAAGGFKDITRIASSSAEMWSQICATNKEQISLLLGKYIDYLTQVRSYIDEGNKDAIGKMFVESKEYRDSISISTKGPVTRSHSFYCDIEDKEGSLNAVTLMLSENHINIKNIEIIHNREYRQGVLLVDFYDEDSENSARKLFAQNGYTIY